MKKNELIFIISILIALVLIGIHYFIITVILIAMAGSWKLLIHRDKMPAYLR